MNLHYFDFVPPPRWNGFRMGRQVRLIPPDTHPDDAPCAIIVSPLVPRSPALPSVETLLEQTLALELSLTGATLTSKHGPMPTKSEQGLAGVYFDVALEGPKGPEHRLYVMLVDELCYYGLSYLASDTSFAANVEDFWTAVRSIKPFAGRIVAPDVQGLDHGE